jgi:hypothetical protein
MVNERSPSMIRLVSPMTQNVNITAGAADKTMGTVAIPDLATAGFYPYWATVRFQSNRAENNFAGVNNLTGALTVALDNGAISVNVGTIPSGVYYFKNTADVHGFSEWNSDAGAAVAALVWGTPGGNISLKIVQAVAAQTSIDIKDIQVIIDVFFT